ncbi:competence type IV pilus minor pilin ComGF [Loigolactobacillus binensis]|uniref:Competence type IV pilus minor pilin ComGF n=1 Tax=Loigolactobacillus binensis TaxID=2559922 RepID=A0ABW3EE98_9LACO|nr:competence type IV pilus minor pilin ComGF [Loigolactobacillus binensis]
MLKLRGKVRPAFTLLETLVALLVFGVTLSLLQTELQAIPQVVTKTFIEEDIRWHLATHQLDTFIAGATFEKVTTNKVYFYQPAKKKHYRVEPYKQMIRLMGTTYGHMPLLNGVTQAKLTYQKPFVQLTVTMQSGHCYQSDFYLPAEVNK